MDYFIDPYADLNTVGGLVVALVLFFFGLISIRLTHHQETLSEQTRLYVIAFASRMAMIIMIYKFGLIAILGDDDSSGWRTSLDIYERWLQAGHNVFTVPMAFWEELRMIVDAGVGHFLHKLLYAVVFLVFGLPGRISAASLNALAGALIPVMAFRMSMQIFGDLKAARYLGWSMALMPSLLVFSGMTAKEPLVVYFEVTALYTCVQISQRRFRIRYFVMFYFSLIAMRYLRFYVCYVFLGAFLAAILVPMFIRSSYRNLLVVLAIMLSPGALYVGYQSAMAEKEESNTPSQGLNTSDIGELQAYGQRMGGSSAVINPFDVTKASEFLPGLAFGLIHLLYAPFPWNLIRGSRLMLLTTPEVLWWYHAGTVRLFRGLRRGLRANLADAIIPILFCLPLLYYYSLIFSNIGLAYRYRAQIYPELILFIGLGYKRIKTLHGYESYRLPEQDEDEIAIPATPFDPPMPRSYSDRFGLRPRDRSPQWIDRGDRFGRL